MSIELSAELEVFVKEQVRRGDYSTEGDVVRDALLLLERRDELRRRVNAGVQQLNAGEFRDYGEHDLDRFLADVAAADAETSNS